LHQRPRGARLRTQLGRASGCRVVYTPAKECQRQWQDPPPWDPPWDLSVVKFRIQDPQNEFVPLRPLILALLFAWWARARRDLKLEPAYDGSNFSSLSVA